MRTFDDMLAKQLQNEDFRKNMKLFSQKWML